MPNTEKRNAYISTGVMILAIGLIFLPGMIQLDRMNGGYALSFVSLFVAICSLVLTIYFWKQSQVFDQIISGKDVLVHWTYQPLEWQQYTDVELKEQINENKGLFLIIAGWALFFGILFWVLDREAGGIVFLVMLALTVLLTIVAFGFPRLHNQRIRRTPGEVWISTTAIYFTGVLLRLNSFGTRIKSVQLKEQTGNHPALIIFKLDYSSRAGRQVRDLRIPVPQGREADVPIILNHFSKDNNSHK